MHGYELRKQLGAMLGPFWQVSWGSLYPALRRLAKSGAVEKVEQPVISKRTTKRARVKTTKTTKSPALSAGRRKTVYRISPDGNRMFTEMLQETAAAVDAEHFTLKLAFFRYLPPETRLTLLERRRAYLQDKLAQFKTSLREYRERVDSYTLSLHNHGIAATQNDIEWIDELITNERDLVTPAAGRAKTRTDAGALPVEGARGKA